ncbi:MAG: hypothetical protein AB7G75_05400 [Candidatus Binatia bacterium]
MSTDFTIMAFAEQLGRIIEQMGRMQRILESYRNEILCQNLRNFALLAAGRLTNIFSM